MIRNRLGSPARALMVAAAVVCWIPFVSAAPAAALPLQNNLATSPQGLTAVPDGSTTINLVWGPPTSTGGKTILRYRVESAIPPATYTLRATPTAAPYRHSGLTAGTTHNYRVRAVYTDASFGTWAYATATTTGTGGVTTGTAPILTAVAAGPTSITLIWSPLTSTGGNTITSYQVEVSADGGSTYAPLTITIPTVTVYEHMGVPAGATRHYRVRAVYANSFGPWSTVAHATTAAIGIPGAPLNLTATADGPSAIDLDWDAPASTGASTIIDYRVEVSEDRGSTWTLLTTTGVTAYRHGRLAAGATRHYRVRARNTTGFGPWTTEVSATTSTGTPPGPPRDLTATAVSSSAIDLSWSPPGSGGSSAIIGYRVERSSTRTGGWRDLEDDTGNTRTTYQDTGLSPNTTYYYRVSAINSFGTGDPSNDENATTERDVPDAPGRLTARARGVSVIELAWRAPSSSGTARVTGYRIQWSPTETGRWRDLEDDTGNTRTTYQDTGLPPNTTRYYRVAALSDAGTSEWSDDAHATTDDLTVPGAPTSLRVNPNGLRGSTELQLTWRPRPTPAGAPSPATASSGVPPVAWPGTFLLPGPTGTATTYVDKGLAPNTTRYYRVRALNAQGQGNPSTAVRGTTNAARPGQPRNLRARAAGPTSITLAWEAPASDGGERITGYTIRVRPANETTWITIPRNTGSTATTFTHGPPAGHRLPVPGGGDQPPGSRPVVVRGEHEHVRPGSGRTVRADGPGGGHRAHRPVVECAPQHRRRSHPRLPDRGLERRRQDLEHHHPPQHQLEGDDGLRRDEPPARDHAALPRRGAQHRGHRTVLEHRARDHRSDRAGLAPEPRRGGRRHLAHRALLARAHERRGRAHHRLPDRGVRRRGHPLGEPGGQLAQHAHDLRAHGAGAGHQAPLPRLGDQPGSAWAGRRGW